MRLVELEPYFHKLSAEGYLIPVAHLDEHTAALDFVCPGCVGRLWAHRIFAPRAGVWTGGGAVWTYTGTSFEDLSFIDSPTGSRSVRVRGGCGSHFNIVNGEIEFHGDSQHASYQPADRFDLVHTPAPPEIPSTGESTMTEDTPKTDTVCMDVAPDGYVRTAVLEFVNGILHQMHCAPYEGPQPQKVFVPVPGMATPPGLLNFLEQQLAPLLKELDALKMQVGQLLPQNAAGKAPAPPSVPDSPGMTG